MNDLSENFAVPHSTDAEQSVKPCVKCGAVVRYKNGDCKPCANKRDAEWRKKNAEKKRESDSAYYATNKEKRNAKSAEWYEKNKEKCLTRGAELRVINKEKYRASSAKWRSENREKSIERSNKFKDKNPDYVSPCIANNPNYFQEYRKSNLERYRIHSQNRRIKKSNGGKLSKGLVDKLYKLQRGVCACCGQPLGDDYHMDHIMPLALGGANEDWNIQLLTARCNLEKRKKHPVEFMQSRGFLL